MRQCPQCGATYEDEVEFCFVDGQPLVPEGQWSETPSIAAPALPSPDQMIPDAGMERILENFEASATPPPVQQRSMTPTPAALQQPPSHVPPLAPTPAARPEPEGTFVPASDGRSGGSALLAVGVAVVLAGLCAGLGGVWFLGQMGTPDTTATAPPTPAPAPAAPAPAPPPPPAAPRTVDLTSDPDGAEVWENGELLCVTPCKVPHDPDAPLPRRFVFKRGGHEDQLVDLTELGAPLRATLDKAAPAPAPRPAPAAPRPRPRPRPAPAPEPDPNVDTDDLRIER